MDKVFWVFLGGGLGSVIRFAISHYFVSVTPHSFPWSTFYANVIATLLLGLIIGTGWTQLDNERGYLFFAVGLCGGFSTFSTFSKEVFELINHQQIGVAISYVVVSLLISVLIFFAAFWAGGQWR